MKRTTSAPGAKRGRILTLAFAAGVLATTASASPEDAYAPSAVDIGGVEKGAGLSLRSHPKVTSDLMTVVEQIGASKSSRDVEDLKLKLIKGRGKPLFVTKQADEQMVQVYIALWDASEKSVKALEAAGVEIEIVSSRRPLVQGFVAVSRVEQVADMDIVREVRLPSYGISTSSGLVELETEASFGVSYVRIRSTQSPLGLVDGTGVNVAVMSNALFGGGISAGPCSILHTITDRSEDGGFVLSPSDLPAEDPCPRSSSLWVGGVHPNPGLRVFRSTFSDHVVDATLQDTSVVPYPEGSAMLEVVHDIAPGAQLSYGNGKTSERLMESRDFYVDGLGAPIDIILENLVFTDEGRFDGSSAVSVHAAEISREENIPFIVSVGGVTTAGDGGVTEPVRFPMMITDFFNGDPRANRARAHSWSKGAVENRDEGLSFDPLDGDGVSVPIDVTLVWDDYWSDTKPRATNDIDMYLVPRATLSLSQAVAASVRVQNGNGTNPIERLTYFPTGNTQPLALVLIRSDSTDNSKTLFTLVIESGRVSESRYLTHGIPLNNADALPPVITVGDLDITQSYEIGAWAVPGRTPGNPELDRFVRWYEGQHSPTVVSYGSVSTMTTRVSPSPVSTSFPQAFWGPSAAASHIAGFAALLRHRFPEMPTYRLGQLLSDTSGVADNGDLVAPFARDVTPEETKPYHNAPKYLRTNAFSLYAALEDGKTDPYGLPETKILLPEPASEVLVADAAGAAEAGSVGSDSATDSAGWNSTSDGGAVVRVTDMGLEIAGGSPSATAAWVSPLLGVLSPGETTPRTQLRTDRMYALEARVGSTESDPLKVPDFRLSVQSEGGDEIYAVTVANNTAGVSNAPTTIGGKQYQVLFRPSNEEVAKDGFRFVFELLGASPGDNAAATLLLRDVTLRELLLPEEPEVAGQ